MARKKLTLSINEQLTESMKIQAVKEKRDVSDIVEQLFREYLKRIKQAFECAASRFLRRRRVDRRFPSYDGATSSLAIPQKQRDQEFPRDKLTFHHGKLT